MAYAVIAPLGIVTIFGGFESSVIWAMVSQILLSPVAVLLGSVLALPALLAVMVIPDAVVIALLFHRQSRRLGYGVATMTLLNVLSALSLLLLAIGFANCGISC
jgi:hypothetical protein